MRHLPTLRDNGFERTRAWFYALREQLNERAK